MKGIFQSLNQVVSFLLELGMLIIYGYFGYRILPEGPLLVRYGLAILLPLAIALFWFFFTAPKANRRLKLPWILIAKMVIMGAGVWMLWQSGLTGLAILFALATVLNLGLSTIWRQV